MDDKVYFVLVANKFDFCCIKTAAEYERRRENFFNELEIVFADVVCNFELNIYAFFLFGDFA